MQRICSQEPKSPRAREPNDPVKASPNVSADVDSGGAGSGG